MNPLTCPACNYANESNRVFCQNCGMRLFKKEEEPAVPTKKKKKRDAEDPVAPRRGRTIDKPMSREELHGRAGGQRHSPTELFASAISILIRLAVIAALLAAIIQMLRPPADVPPVAPAFDEAQAKAFESAISAARNTPSAQVFPIPFKNANSFLAQRIDLKPGGLVRCLRCYVAPGAAPDKFTFGSEQHMIAMPVYVHILFSLHRDGQAMTARPEAMSIGRLPMPSFAVPWMARTADTTAQTVGSALEHLRKASSIKISADAINVIWAEPAMK